VRGFPSLPVGVRIEKVSLVIVVPGATHPELRFALGLFPKAPEIVADFDSGLMLFDGTESFAPGRDVGFTTTTNNSQRLVSWFGATDVVVEAGRSVLAIKTEQSLGAQMSITIACEGEVIQAEKSADAEVQGEGERQTTGVLGRLRAEAVRARISGLVGDDE